MEIIDRVYGKCAVSEPVLKELIASRPLQRLKGINQAGASQYVLQRPVSRYEHSVGTMLLLRKLGATVEEQIAGLLHDTPHTAFSHVVDFVFRDESHSHDYHEKFHEKVLSESEVPEILERYGFSFPRILDEDNFPLLERPIPDLCADRIDYTLRDMAACLGMHEKAVMHFKALSVFKSEAVFSGIDAASRFAEDYLHVDEAIWSNPFEVAIYQILADALAIGLRKGAISMEDLFMDDAYVFSRLKASGVPEILDRLSLLHPGLNIAEDSVNYDFHTRNKLRFIDPKFSNPDGSVSRLSDSLPSFRKRLEEHRIHIERGCFIRILG